MTITSVIYYITFSTNLADFDVVRSLNKGSIRKKNGKLKNIIKIERLYAEKPYVTVFDCSKL